MSIEDWKEGSPRELIEALRPGGWIMGQSSLLDRWLRLHKTDLISDLRQMRPDKVLTWKIEGDPDATGRLAPKRRTVVLWLGK
jgi:hypothetical protein